MPSETENVDGKVLYQDMPSEYVFGTLYKSYHQIVMHIWLSRTMAIALIAITFSLNLLFNELPMIVLIGVAISLLLLVYESEIYIRKDLYSATPIVIYENGIRLYSSPIRRLLGFNGYIPREEIVSIEVRRGSVYEMRSEGDSKKAFRWNNVPIEFTIRTNKGKKRWSGKRHPNKISEITNIMNTAWGIPIGGMN